MDNLSKDAMAAMRAGMSYGKWKALHPHTKPDPLGITGGRAIQRELFEICPVCGNVFEITPEHRVTCSTECRKERTRTYNRNYMRARRGQ